MALTTFSWKCRGAWLGGVFVTTLAMAQPAVMRQVTPPWAVAAYRWQDLTGDGRNDLLCVGRDGRLQLWRGTSQNGGGLVPAVSEVTLAHPRRTLLSLTRWSGSEGPWVLVALGPEGLGSYPLGPEGVTPQAAPLDRRLRWTIRLQGPTFAEVTRDLDGDDRPEVLVPGLRQIELWQRIDPAETSPETPPFRRVGTVEASPTVRRSFGLEDTQTPLSESLAIPDLHWQDVNGDGVADLIVRHGLRVETSLGRRGTWPTEPTRVLDLSMFRDPAASRGEIRFGDVLSVEKDPRLLDVDLNRDGILDAVIFHGRKIWVFLGTPSGPQYSEPTTVLKTAEDITACLVCPLDEDPYPDLLLLKLWIPSLPELLAALVSDWDLSVRAVGYRSLEGRSFEVHSAWQCRLTVHVEPVLSLWGRGDWGQGLNLDPPLRSPAEGDFDADGHSDLALLTAEGKVSFWSNRSLRPEQGWTTVLEQIGRWVRRGDEIRWDLAGLKQQLNDWMDAPLAAAIDGCAAAAVWSPDVPGTVERILPARGLRAARDGLLVVSTEAAASDRLSFSLWFPPASPPAAR